jgi:GT2 family glycosyltransferase
VQIVFGNEDVRHLVEVLLPSISDSSSEPIEVWARNYSNDATTALPTSVGSTQIREFTNDEGRPIGFAENHNYLFNHRDDLRPFVLVNPDCILTHGSIDQLFLRYQLEKRTPGIVEGRQWPFEHPKEFDPVSLETPWASGAFCLIDAEFYRSVGGMDETYFMYLEDIDLSWRAWLAGSPVIYEQKSVVVHFSGAPFYRSDVRSSEEYYGLRNFIALNYKFFGEEGEEHAISLLKENYKVLGHAVNIAMEDYKLNLRQRVQTLDTVVQHPKIKVLGLNQFHKLRTL